jgi:4-aminobutyrate aminotransferase
MHPSTIADEIQVHRRWLSPSYTYELPLVVERGEGAYVWDVEGTRYLDMVAGLASCSTGHAHPRVVKAIQQQAARFLHVSSSDVYHPLQARLAERLAGLCPWMEVPTVYFGTGGADATEAAIKLARYHTKRPYVLGFYRGFHGRSYGAMSLTASRPVQRDGFGPHLPGILHAPYPYPLREAVGYPTTDQCLAFLRETLATHYCSPREIAAVILEPIQGEGGYVPAPDAFLRGLQAFCREHGILLVMDEVQSGMGRTGTWWAHQHIEGLHPDVVLSAKGIASGLPLCAVIAPRAVMSWPPGSHASTFGGNPLSCAAALETLAILEQEILPGLPEKAKVLMARLQAIQARFPAHVAQVRGRGLMIGLELVDPNETGESETSLGALTPNPALLREVIHRLFHYHRIYTIGCGQSTLRLCPPLMISPEALHTFTDALEECLHHVVR